MILLRSLGVVYLNLAFLIGDVETIAILMLYLDVGCQGEVWNWGAKCGVGFLVVFFLVPTTGDLTRAGIGPTRQTLNEGRAK